MLKTLPKIIVVNDYHTLKYLPSDIEDWTGLKVKCKEIGFNGNYVGIVYQDKLPSDEKIRKLLKQFDVELDED